MTGDLDKNSCASSLKKMALWNVGWQFVLAIFLAMLMATYDEFYRTTFIITLAGHLAATLFVLFRRGNTPTRTDYWVIEKSFFWLWFVVMVFGAIWACYLVK